MPEEGNDTKATFPSPGADGGHDSFGQTKTNEHTYAEQAVDVKELQRVNEELRQARQAALNFMEDAILSKEALRQSEEKYRTKLEQHVLDRTAELNQTKELLQATLDSSFYTIQVFQAVRNEQGTIVDFVCIINNRKAVEQNGDLTGKRLLDQNPRMVPAGLFDKFVAVTETGVLIEHDVHFSYEQLDAWYHQSLVKMGDGFVMNSADITERKEAELEILRLKDEITQKATDRYFSFFNSIDEGFYLAEVIFDENNQPVDVLYLEENPSAIRIVGTSFKGKKLTEINPAYEAYWYKIFGEVVLAGQSQRLERYSEADKKWYNFYVSKIGGENSRQITIVFQDITDRKQAEETLRESEERKAFLLKLSDVLRPLTDIVAIQNTACELLAETLDVSRVYYGEVAEDDQHIVVKAGFAATEEMKISGTFHMESFGPEVINELRKGNALIVESIAERTDLTTEEKSNYAAISLEAFAVFSLVKNNRFSATFNVHHNAPRRWKDSELFIMEETAERIWAAVQRARVEEALRRSEERFRTLADAVPQVIWTNDADGKAEYFNQRWYDFSGLSYEQSVGLGWQAIVHPYDAPASVEKWTAALAAGEIFDTEFRLRNTRGTYCWFVGRNVPLKDERGIVGWFGSATDINDLKTAQEALRQSKERLRLIIESAKGFAIFTTDTNGIINSWNLGAADIFGWSEEEILGQSGDVLFTPEDRAINQPQSEREIAATIGMAPDVRWHLHKSGSRVFIQGVSHPVYDAAGVLDGFVKIGRDNTVQHNAEEALRKTSETYRLQLENEVEQRTAELKEINTNLRYANENLQQFASIASHDLQEPLRKMKMFASLLHKHWSGLIPDEGKEVVRKITRASDRMGQLIREVLEYSKIAYSTKEFVPTDLHQVFGTVMGDLDLLLEETGCEVHYEGPLPRIEAIPLQMHQLFYNLFTNAVKFRKEGTAPVIRISSALLSPEEVAQYPELAQDAAYIRISVSDDGIGFDPQFAEQIFQIFERLHSVDEYEGTGVGLALCKKIIENHRGLIMATSREGEGAEFRLVLPIEQKRENKG